MVSHPLTSILACYDTFVNDYFLAKKGAFRMIKKKTAAI